MPVNESTYHCIRPLTCMLLGIICLSLTVESVLYLLLDVMHLHNIYTARVKSLLGFLQEPL